MARHTPAVFVKVDSGLVQLRRGTKLLGWAQRWQFEWCIYKADLKQGGSMIGAELLEGYYDTEEEALDALKKKLRI